MPFHSWRLVLSALAISIGNAAGPVLAADADEVGKAIVAAVEASGHGTASYAGASANGEVVTIEEFKISDGHATLTIPAIVITGVAERDKGGFTAKSVALDHGSVATQRRSVKWETATITDAILPSPEEIKARIHTLTPLGKATVTGIEYAGNDLPVPVGIDKIDVAVAAGPDGAPNHLVLSVDGISLPQRLFDAPRRMFLMAVNVLSSLGGYSNGFKINLLVDGALEHTTDTLTLNSLSIDAAEVGRLVMTGRFSGVAPSTMKSAKDTKSKVKLESFSARFDDRGVVEKVLETQAQQQGMDRAAILAQYGYLVQLTLNLIDNAAFRDKVGTAVAAFLANPKSSITFTAQPGAPVGFDAIFAAFINEPGKLPDLVGAGITTNN